jgi:hypothetical protein
LLNNGRNGESECDGVRHDASCVDAWLAPEGASQQLRVSLVRHFGRSAVLAGGVVGPYHHAVGSSDFILFDSPSGRLQRAISPTYWPVNVTTSKTPRNLLCCDLRNVSSISYSRLRNSELDSDTCILLPVATCL